MADATLNIAVLDIAKGMNTFIKEVSTAIARASSACSYDFQVLLV